MILLCVDVLLQLSVNVQVSVYDPPHSVCDPVITPVVDPLIVQAVVFVPLLYASDVPTGGASLHAIVNGVVDAYTACAAG